MFFDNEPNISRLGTQPVSIYKQTTLFFTGWFGFHLIAYIVKFLLTGIISMSTIYTFLDVWDMPNTSMLVNIGAYLVLFGVLCFIVNIDFPKLLKSFKRWESYLAGFLGAFIVIAVTLVYVIVLYIFNIKVPDNANQSAVNNLINYYGVSSFIVFGFVAPICEELTYRVGLFSWLSRRSKLFAYVIGITIFALIHFTLSLDRDVFLNELLNLPLYLFGAAVFCFLYDTYGFAASLTAHILNNTISFALTSVIH